MALLCVATPLWAVALVARLSIEVSVALDRSAQSEMLLELVHSWTTAGWYVAAVLVAAAFAGIRRRHPVVRIASRVVGMVLPGLRGARWPSSSRRAMQRR